MLSEKGKTALGPALAASLGLISSSKPGSMILLCTDGLANIGLGALDTDLVAEKSKGEYENMAVIAKEKGISFSIITIKGETCNAEVLGKLTDETNGTITRVSPEEITKDFANILKDEIVATNVEMRVQMHKGLE